MCESDSLYWYCTLSKKIIFSISSKSKLYHFTNDF